MPYCNRRICPICGKNNLLKLSEHLRQVHHLTVEQSQPYLKTALYCNRRDSGSQHHLEGCPYPHFELENMFNMIWVGSTKSGKTHFVKNILTQNCIRYLDSRKPRQIFWFYNQWQESYKSLLKQLEKDIKFTQGLPSLSEDLHEISTDHNNLFVFDDLMGEAVDSAILSMLFTRGRHRNASFFLLLQNKFPKGRYNTDIACNTQYIFMFRFPSDRKQLDILADRIFAKHRPKFMDVYELETEKPYGYLLIDNQPGTVKEQQVVGDILGNCHAYPNIIQSSIQPLREEPLREQPLRKQPKKDCLLKVLASDPPTKVWKPRETWKPFEEASTSEEDSDISEYESESSEEVYEFESSEGVYESQSSEGEYAG